MANENNSGDGGKKVIAAVGIAALLFLLGSGLSMGLGGGQSGSGDAQQSAAQTEQASEEKAEDAKNEEIPDEIVVTIKQDKVTINGHEVANKDELRTYVEEYNSDGRTFTLEEEQSILETYNWVKEVFDELDIQLKNSR